MKYYKLKGIPVKTQYMYVPDIGKGQHHIVLSRERLTWYFRLLSLSLHMTTPLLATVSMEKERVHLALYTRSFD